MKTKLMKFTCGLLATFLMAVNPLTTITTFAGQNNSGSVNETTQTETSLITLEEHPTKTVASIMSTSNAPSTKKEFYKEASKKLVSRPASVTLYYNGDITKIVPDLETFLQELSLVDDKKTSDDADFLMGGILHLSSRSYVAASKKSSSIELSIKYTESAAQVKKVNSKTKAALKSLGVSKMSDVGKVKAIHDYVVNTFQYDQSMTDHSAYGGLVASKHTTVCQGYALMMYKMLTDAGIEAHYVTGYAGEAHAWNIVKLNKKWYYLDATWDDPCGGAPTLTYNYFLIGSSTLYKDHTIDNFYKKKYKLNSSNLNWQKSLKKSTKSADKKVAKEQTKAQKTAAQEATRRNVFVKELNDTLDKELHYNSASEADKKMYDIYKKTLEIVARKLTNKQFDRLLTDNNFAEAYINVCTEAVFGYLIDPITEYMQSDEFANATVELVLTMYSEDELAALSEQELKAVMEDFYMALFIEILDEASQEYMDDIVTLCLDSLNSY